MRFMACFGGRQALQSEVRKASRGAVMPRVPHSWMNDRCAVRIIVVVCSSTLREKEMVVMVTEVVVLTIYDAQVSTQFVQ